jgi:hypothetical protein
LINALSITALIVLSMFIGVLGGLYAGEESQPKSIPPSATPEPPCDYAMIAELTRACSPEGSENLACLSNATRLVCPWKK